MFAIIVTYFTSEDLLLLKILSLKNAMSFRKTVVIIKVTVVSIAIIIIIRIMVRGIIVDRKIITIIFVRDIRKIISTFMKKIIIINTFVPRDREANKLIFINVVITSIIINNVIITGIRYSAFIVVARLIDENFKDILTIFFVLGTLYVLWAYQCKLDMQFLVQSSHVFVRILFWDKIALTTAGNSGSNKTKLLKKFVAEILFVVLISFVGGLKQRKYC